MSTIQELVQQHSATLHEAVKANTDRTFYAHWPEAPSGKIYGETANADGEAAFKQQLNAPFGRLVQTGPSVGDEVSPYGFPLGITYPTPDVPTLLARAEAAQAQWQDLSPEERAAVLIEALERGSRSFFEIGYATMHTTGQGFVMAFQASGPHAFDRALEAVAMGYAAQASMPDHVMWTKPMGKINVSIDKTYRNVPKGLNLVIGCSTFPVWNTVPGMFAGLVTGNAVIVKPHPGAIYPIAIVVAAVQQTLKDAGLDADLVQLAADTAAAPITKELLQAARIIDYTGGSAFGDVVETAAANNRAVMYSEKAGLNSVILDSTNDLDAALDNLAFALSLYSGQMCTAPQNIYIAKDGMIVNGERISVDAVAAKLREKIDALVNNPKMGPSTLGAIQNPMTLERIAKVKELGGVILCDSVPVAQPGFDQARSVSPLLVRTQANGPLAEHLHTEWFGPIAFLIETEDWQQALDMVIAGIHETGALTTLVHTTDEEKMQQAEDSIVDAGAPVAFNFTSFVWVNQSAAFSDFHGTGANPAGTAAFADWSFVTGRYNVIGVRKQA